MVPPHHGLHTTGIPHPAIVTPSVKQESSQSDVGLHSSKHQDSKKEEEKKKPHIKKPLNAFMLYMKEMRAKVVAECTLKESAAINQILGRRWHALSREEQAKYYELARKERQLHMQLYPGWSARDNYVRGYGKKKKRKREKQAGESNEHNECYLNPCLSLPPIADLSAPKKCRARFGLDQQNNWCGPCRRKKKCIRYIQGEGSCVSPPSSDGSLLDSPPSSPTMLDSPTRDSNSQSEQTQPLSLSLKPEPLARLCMPHSPLTESPVRKPSNLPAIICQNGTDHSHQPSSLPPSTPYSLSTAQPSTSFLPTHRSLAGTQLQPLSLGTMNAEPSRETTFIVMLLLLLKCTEHKGLKMNKCVNMPSNGGRNFFFFSFFLFSSTGGRDATWEIGLGTLISEPLDQHVGVAKKKKELKNKKKRKIKTTKKLEQKLRNCFIRSSSAIVFDMTQL
ncbi:hypothetical protein AB205_0222130 [Aquarana catesbeiana]|uniref:HMG box domain-containing protein n=1 Tax=Aquarana catesbeiana TaxID=8400 RepID=A0A2G9P236_AQUCT|nr:hypothetical protein AB205_0222130 [Aquarana catesbeiana]